MIFSTSDSLDVNLGGKVALGVDLVVHVQRGVLAVTEILLGVGVEHTETQSLLVLEIRPDSLALFAVDDRGAGVLAERKDSLHGSLSVAQELQGNILVVLRSLRISEDGRDLFIMSSPKHELAIVETLLGDQRKGLG